MNPEEYLMQIKTLEQDIHYRKLEIDFLRKNSDNIPSPSFEERLIHQNAGDANHVRKLNLIWMREEELEKQKGLLTSLKQEAYGIINQLSEPNDRLVLFGRYFQNLTFEDIGKQLFITKGTAYKWLKQAEDKLRLPESVIQLET